MLLDVPPGLTAQQVLEWRQQFASSFAAAYHPWPLVPDPAADRLVDLNPSAVAAGIIARQSKSSRGTCDPSMARGPARAGAGGIFRE